jgi:hypothetical protein
MADYGSLQDHADAFLALIDAEPLLTWYPAESSGANTLPNGAAPPFLTVHFVVDRPLGGRLTTRSTRMRMRAHCHCVGADDIAARAVSDLLAGAVLDRVPLITGRTCFPIRHETSHPPREDESTGALTATLTEIYRLESLPGVDGS